MTSHTTLRDALADGIGAAPALTQIDVSDSANDPHRHPLLQLFRPTIATRSIELLADSINAAIDIGYRGLGMFGYARAGKTEAVCYLIQHPAWMGSRRAARVMIDAPETRKRSDSTFFQSILALLGVRIPARANSDQLCALVMGRLIEICLSEDSHLAMVFIDEAQRLLPSDYENLVTLDNRMTRAGFYLFCVFVHQRDITGFTNEALPQALDHPPHVSGRFLIRKHEFTGPRDSSDVAYALDRYDTDSEWPPGSGVSYTRHFARQAYDQHGFRLAHYAIRMWEAAQNLRSQERLPPDWTWPMKSFEGTVIYLLTVTIPRKGATFELLTEEDIVEALLAAGLIELEKSRHTYRPQGAKP